MVNARNKKRRERVEITAPICRSRDSEGNESERWKRWCISLSALYTPTEPTRVKLNTARARAHPLTVYVFSLWISSASVD